MTLAGIRRFFSIIVIPMAVVVVQIHSIPFWHDFFKLNLQTGTIVDWFNWIPGPLASIGLEFLAIWRWLVPKENWIHYAFAILITSCLIAGPIINTSVPLWKQTITESASSEDIQKQEEKVMEAKADVKYYEDLIASGRLGWQDDIRAARETLKKEEGKLESLKDAQGIKIVSWSETAARSVLTIIVLLLFTLGIVTSLDSISRDFGAALEARDAILKQIAKGRDLNTIAQRHRINAELLYKVVKGEPVTEAFLVEMIRRFEAESSRA